VSSNVLQGEWEVRRGQRERGLVSHWPWLVFRGVIAMLFGLVAFVRLGPTGLALILAFGAYAFVGGCAALATAGRRDRPKAGHDTLVLDGVMGIAVALLSLTWPARVAVTLVWVVGAWAIATGVVELGNAVLIRKVLAHEWSLGLAGGASIAFGFLMFFRPLAGGVAILWSLGAYALIFGALMIALGLHLRRFGPASRGARVL
jgi:uncharacterized membrane protein HdeD (DUF308 family)